MIRMIPVEDAPRHQVPWTCLKCGEEQIGLQAYATSTPVLPDETQRTPQDGDYVTHSGCGAVHLIVPDGMVLVNETALANTTGDE